MSLQSSISQQLHNTIANKQTSTQKDFVTITNIINNVRLSSIIIHST